MLTTGNNSDLRVMSSDSTVYVSSGVVRLGNQVVLYRGGTTTLQHIASLGGDSSRYQNVALYLGAVGYGSDLSGAYTTPVASLAELTYPVLPYDSTNTYGPVHPLALMTLWTPDGTNVELVSMSKVN